MNEESKGSLKKPLAAIAASTLVVALVLVGIRLLGIEQWLYDTLESIRQAGFVGRLWLAALIVLVVIALLPGAPLTLGAGLLYGPFEGGAIVVTATTIGATLAMLLGRYLLSPAVSRLVRGHAKLAAVLALPERDDWRLVAFLRMIPFFPSKLTNYVLGLTPLSLRAYIVGSFLGFWPISLFNVWLGSLAGNMVDLPAAGRPEGPLGAALWIGGFVVSAILLVVLARLARARLDAAMAERSDSPPANPSSD